MRWRFQPGRWLLVVALFLIAGCASPIRATDQNSQNNSFWSGRLALNVDADQAQSFSAGFELKGNAETGELALYNPLGSTLAVLAWAPGSATLRSNDQTRNFGSLDELVRHAIGAAIPVAALFDWLQGVNTPVPGWQADLSQLAGGRLVARRSAPTPAAELRLALEK
ncbi:outer membrane lipoprotein LolB [Rhodoferax sediminis]|uniref:Outer-membrane lipoprotein LolB n=1 Tax=Rhodoferax sediminis TaxID=2509614 RepID=A0A515D908_9BURK|nr:outer membrane lipoprotein LolB [Rhodoferax sediminis]QDL36903.1 outer membrane lipoprotein LolB [Rhodoferax sediminis]